MRILPVLVPAASHLAGSFQDRSLSKAGQYWDDKKLLLLLKKLIFKKTFKILWVLGVGVHMSAVRMEATRASEPLKLELPEGMSHYVGAGNQTQGLLRAAACANS